MSYERKEIYTPEEIFPFLGRDDHEFDGDSIHMDSLRYATFQKDSCTCVMCGLKGTFFAKERAIGKGGIPTNNGRYHFNLYGVKEDGTEVLFTKDHILPKSKNGKDVLENMQTFCCICNSAKGNIIEGTENEQEILRNAIEKNALPKLAHMDEYSLLTLIRYARGIGYNEGWMEGRKELKEQAKKNKGGLQ